MSGVAAGNRTAHSHTGEAAGIPCPGRLLRAALVALAVLSVMPRHASASIESITVSPASPSPGDPVTVSAAGSFPDFCWQVTDIVCGSQPGNLITIDVYVVYYDYGTCPPPEVPYSMSCSQGAIPPGTYIVRVAEHHQICDDHGCSSFLFAEVKWDTFSVADPLAVDGGESASRSIIEPARPNPFFSSTSLAFVVLREAATVRLEILDVAGHRVRRLPQDAAPGRHAVEWDGRRDDGSPAPAGVYYFAGSIAGRPVRVPVVLVK